MNALKEPQTQSQKVSKPKEAQNFKIPKFYFKMMAM
jgi:hypothetical protein